MSIKLIYRGETTVPVEIEGLTPDWAVDKSLAEIERFEIFHGNRKLPLAEMFTVTGDARDKRFDFEGNLAGVHWIGAHMGTGQIHIHGPGGRHIGSEMRAGKIVVGGDAGGWVGCEMRGGQIHVHGNAGHLVGAAYRGSPKGMTGGRIVVDGNAGNEVGLSMQKGIVVIRGNAGDMLGFNMADGTIIVIGNCGIRAGAGLHGGAIGIFGQEPPSMLPTFRFDRAAQPEKLRLALGELRDKGLPIDEVALPVEADVYVGDLIESGTGEIYCRRSGGS